MADDITEAIVPLLGVAIVADVASKVIRSQPKHVHIVKPEHPHKINFDLKGGKR